MKKCLSLVLVFLLGCGSENAPESAAIPSIQSTQSAAAAPSPTAETPTSASAPAAAPPVASEPAVVEGSATNALATAHGPSANFAADVSRSFDRQVIRNATLQLTHADPVVTTEQATDLAVHAGGFVLDGKVERLSGGLQTSQVVLRVPGAAFEKTLAAIRKLGALREEKITGQDVTEELVDTESRTRALRVLQARLLALLERTGGLSDLLQVEQELARVGGEIERYEGRMRFLRERVALASIELTVFEPEPTPVPIKYEPETVLSRVGAAFSKSARLCLGVIEGGIVALGFLLPFSMFLIVFLLPFIWLRRRLRATRPAA